MKVSLLIKMSSRTRIILWNKIQKAKRNRLKSLLKIFISYFKIKIKAQVKAKLKEIYIYKEMDFDQIKINLLLLYLFRDILFICSFI